ncbi:MAG: chlorite dismutase family protein [Gemmatimonadota bacterium]|nr:chlorite dismutase family protein [Gemmatimonadota bacterium]
MSAEAHPPATLEGWFALHQVVRLIPGTGAASRDVSRALSVGVAAIGDRAATGWSAVAALTTAPGDFLLAHFRASFDELAAVRAELSEAEAFAGVEEVFSMVSVAEAGLYHITAELARAAAARGGTVGDAAYLAELESRREAERSSEHVQRRLFPQPPPGMPYVCFYPMSKRRDPGQNWYELTLDERSRLMRSHGETGRKYAGRIQQVITGGIGFSEWEWGVTLFAKDPLDFKKLVTDMRFDEVSAKYAEFGPFFVGKFLRARGGVS